MSIHFRSIRPEVAIRQLNSHYALSPGVASALTRPVFIFKVHRKTLIVFKSSQHALLALPLPSLVLCPPSISSQTICIKETETTAVPQMDRDLKSSTSVTVESSSPDSLNSKGSVRQIHPYHRRLILSSFQHNVVHTGDRRMFYAACGLQRLSLFLSIAYSCELCGRSYSTASNRNRHSRWCVVNTPG
jgi:hypothetical protein